PTHRKVVGYDNYGGDVCVNNYTTADGGHGTWTSQHAAGSISNMSSNPDTTHTPNGNFDDGIARGAKVYFQDIGTSAGTLAAPLDLGPSITAAIGKGSFVQNHSWGTSSPTYDTEASNLDTAIFNNPGMVVTVSAGNGGATGQGTIGSPSTAKNVICVGGADAANPSFMFADCNWDGTAGCASTDLGSGRGPVATSLRTKPDILGYMAFSATVGGENEAGDRPHAMCQTDATKTVYYDFSNLQNFGGTSFSAPEIAGLAAVARDYFVSGYYPGGAPSGSAVTPTGSLIKALILASGEDMASTAFPTTSISLAKRYSNDVGYGRANLRSVLHIGSGAPFLWVKNGDSLGDGSTKTFLYNVNGNSIPLRVMMVYYDAAGNAIQKDADLKVTIGANVYWGNNFSGGWSTSATSVRDHTNPTEGVFLDAAHGLPGSGTVQVDVIGFNDPGGMNYSLVVSGDVAAQDVTQVSLDKGKYNCSDTVTVTVNDAAASSPVSVTLTSRNSVSTVIDTQVVSCTGSGGVFTGSIATGSGIAVADGGSLTATYAAVTPAVAAVSCQVAVADGGYIIEGGCDNNAAGTDAISGPLFNGGSNEFYTKYMDAGEYNAYTVGFVNQTGAALTDLHVHLSFSGAGASKMTALNNDILVGAVPADGLTGAVFQVFTDPSTAGLTLVNMNFDITSPADGFTTAKRLTQIRPLQANDIVTRQKHCSVFDTSPLPSSAWYESVITGATTNPWRWIGSATQPATVGSENRTDGICSSSAANKGMMVGNSATTAANNFNNNADSFLLTNFQPVLTGNNANGQPYFYQWKWHSFYHASETLSNQGGVWGAFYDDQWNSTTNPTGDQASAFPIVVCCYYQTIFDYVGIWNWETANTGTPDDPHFGPSTGGAPNQIIITFNGVGGQATTSTWFAYGHEHTDIYYFNGGTGHGTHRDVALDDDDLVYDQWYADAQVGNSCGVGGQVGQVAFDRYSYDNCPSSTAVLSVVDANATSPLTVTVTSPGTGDSEVVTLTGSAPFFSGTLTLATNTGAGNNNGVLFVLPSETIAATYTDTSPAGSTTTHANIGCTGGNVLYVSNTQVADNGDNDTIADNNETVTLDLTIHNGLATNLTNTKVSLFSTSPNIDCIPDNHALYGTVVAGADATNPPGDRFTFHVASAVACTDPQNPPSAQFTVVITGDGFDGSATLQTFSINLDLDNTGGSFNYTQNFNVDPGWLTGATPDDTGTCSGYSNSFHWCAACGNGNGGYGAWVGNNAFGTALQTYPPKDSSTLYSPVFLANGNVTLQFDVAYETETPYDGAIVQSKVGAGNWTLLPFTTPAQAATFTGDFCSPLASGVTAWTGGPVSYTTTNAATVAASVGQTVQFRWRLGSDSSVVAGGLGVDNVNIGNLQQQVCEPTRNTGLPGCPAACVAPSALTNNSAVDVDSNADTGVQVSWAQDAGNWGDGGSGTRTYDVLRNGSPVATGIAYGTTTYNDNTGVNGTSYTYSVRYNNGCGLSAATAGVAAADVVCSATTPTGQTVVAYGAGTLNWTAVSGATWYDVVRGTLSVLQSSGGNFTTATDSCSSNDQVGTSYTDGSVPALGDGYWYLVRAGNCAGQGTYDEGQPSQIGSRDAEIAASGHACP
ncbi:MAG: S8 family serine peptidase, partial [Acidobacteriia bacterium]|nr:S8 family serine peptidase [Terriglobia bacterium]